MAKFAKEYKTAILNILAVYDVIDLYGRCPDIYDEYRSYVNKILKQCDYDISPCEVHDICSYVFYDEYKIPMEMAQEIAALFASHQN